MENVVKLINLTPHEVNIRLDIAVDIPSGSSSDWLFPTQSPSLEVEGQPGEMYIVSIVVSARSQWPGK